MKKRTFLMSLFLVFAAEAAALFLFAAQPAYEPQDAVMVNEALRSVEADWDDLKRHENKTALDYAVLDLEGSLLYKTDAAQSTDVHEAVVRRDTVLDIVSDGRTVGKLIVKNDCMQAFAERQKRLCTVLAFLLFAQLCVCAGYACYLDRTVIRPFQKLEGLAERIAGGNLDIPLAMDRRNLFGAFTESFDLMRDQLQKARLAEMRANESKKELVAKVSHDIKTPVASIRAASEVGAALADNGKLKDNYTQIIRKADQIDALIENLFTATLEELRQLSVTPEDVASGALKEMLEGADYLHRASLPGLPECLLRADPLRIQQVFDNIFANSYKYAGTDITVSARLSDAALLVGVEDCGGGVGAKELSHMKEKFWRGDNAAHIEGAGLGLYISDYFMREMGGALMVENAAHGLRVTVRVPFSGAEAAEPQP